MRWHMARAARALPGYRHAAARITYLALVSYADFDTGENARPSVATLMEATGAAHGSVVDHLARLVAVGLIEVQERSTQHRPTTYRLTAVPAAASRPAGRTVDASRPAGRTPESIQPSGGPGPAVRPAAIQPSGGPDATSDNQSLTAPALVVVAHQGATTTAAYTDTERAVGLAGARAARAALRPLDHHDDGATIQPGLPGIDDLAGNRNEHEHRSAARARPPAGVVAGPRRSAVARR